MTETHCERESPSVKKVDKKLLQENITRKCYKKILQENVTRKYYKKRLPSKL